FGQFTSNALGQAAYLQAQGLGPGDTVILIMPQGIPLMTAFASAVLLGAVPAILAYPNFKVEPAKYRSGLAGVSANLRARLIVLDQAFPEELLAHVTTGDNTKLVRCVNAYPSSAAVVRANSVAPDRVAFIQHSAGTTGLQKGVALSHAAVL